jgi:hypothetical protein
MNAKTNFFCFAVLHAVLGIRMIRMFLDLPDPDPFGRGTDSVRQRYGSVSFPFLINVLSGLK